MAMGRLIGRSFWAFVCSERGGWVGVGDGCVFAVLDVPREGNWEGRVWVAAGGTRGRGEGGCGGTRGRGEGEGRGGTSKVSYFLYNRSSRRLGGIMRYASLTHGRHSLERSQHFFLFFTMRACVRACLSHPASCIHPSKSSKPLKTCH